jgi:hypothetical protein
MPFRFLAARGSDSIDSIPHGLKLRSLILRRRSEFLDPLTTKQGQSSSKY